MNGDGAAGNDLIYIPKDTSEMNFVAFTRRAPRHVHRRAAGAAFEAYINQDKYSEQAPRASTRSAAACCIRWSSGWT